LGKHFEFGLFPLVMTGAATTHALLKSRHVPGHICTILEEFFAGTSSSLGFLELKGYGLVKMVSILYFHMSSSKHPLLWMPFLYMVLNKILIEPDRGRATETDQSNLRTKQSNSHMRNITYLAILPVNVKKFHSYFACMVTNNPT
jgi:hypothetical protein